jgi:hypothetical protein
MQARRPLTSDQTAIRLPIAMLTIHCLTAILTSDQAAIRPPTGTPTFRYLTASAI